MAGFDLSERWRPCQGGMVLNAGLANPSIPPTRGTPDTPRKRFSRGPSLNGADDKKRRAPMAGPRYGCHSIAGARLNKTLPGRVSDDDDSSPMALCP